MNHHPMGYFTQEFLDFFKELTRNNKKVWFDKNRKTYEQIVREPFKAFISELIFRIQEFEVDFEVTPKQAIFRINRDIRFAKDKTPYKTYVSANMQPGGRTQAGHPGYYIHLGVDIAHVGGGAHHVTKEHTYGIRSKIMTSSS
ncbi:MAG: DUF2461 domain-containing protein, partial [Candidatus Heimdallarchaeota archaeon]|nr:DUF2461 domain-containing protein [Candidatus Heimdallarchaeota archaeon]